VNDQLSGGAKALRSLGLTVFVVSAVFCGMLALTYLYGDQFLGWRRLAAAVALALAAAAAVGMTVDAFDLWVRGRRMTSFSLRMWHSFIFICVLVALVLTIVARAGGLLIVLTPALMVYLFAVVMRPAPKAGSPAARRPGTPARQRRGGRKRK
jgi:hypothetical protein